MTGKDPHGRSYYWISGDPLTDVKRDETETDLGAVSHGLVSITPIHLDMTEHSLLDELRGWEAALEPGAN